MEKMIGIIYMGDLKIGTAEFDLLRDALDMIPVSISTPGRVVMEVHSVDLSAFIREAVEVHVAKPEKPNHIERPYGRDYRKRK